MSQGPIVDGLCQHCQSISLDALLQARESARWGPKDKGWGTPHHDSFGRLRDCALGGCELCSAIVAQASRCLIEAESLVQPGDDDPIYTTINMGSITFTAWRNPEKKFVFFQHDPIATFDFETPDPPALGGVQRPTELDQGSPLAFEWARNKLDECVLSHSRCNNPSPKPPVLPTRVIDVGDDTTAPRLVAGRPARGRWIALTHCWGGKIDNVTLTTNLEAKQRAMPLDELPPNFRDAILITRGLGVRYLWIDALCIIQDSNKVDWPEEAARMRHYYSQSFLTVSAANAADSTRGILQRREPSKSLRLHLSSESLGWAGDVRLIDDVERSRARQSLSPLDQRGWCLQEKCLPPRTLAYTELGLTWVCLDNTECEWEHTGRDTFYSDEKAVVREFLPQTPEGKVQTDLLSHQGTRYDPYGAAMSWVSLVEAYRSRMLTYPSDKLPAISGLAQVIAQGLPGSGMGAYLAGLWRCSLLNGMSWSVRKLGDGRPVQPRCSRPHAYRAPSWSWASIDGPVSFPAGRGYKMQPLQYEDDSSKYPDMATVLEASVELQDKDQPYGQVTGGRVRLRALWLAVALHADDFSELRADGDPGYLRFSLHKASRPDPSNLWADHVRVRPLVDDDNPDPESVCNIVGGLDVTPGPGERLLDQAGRLCLGLLMMSNCTFLLLQPNERFPGTFKRVGCADLTWNHWRGRGYYYSQWISGEPVRFDDRFIDDNTAEVVIT
ncbi:hypothetical protein MCOR22_008587 [Pyricularia oryzae]|nr:hypothetical protein MCOR22_008587 [Pyricularia oryzae]